MSRARVLEGIWFLLRNENVLKVIMVMVAHICEYTKKHEVIYFKCVKYMVCELHLNIGVNFKKWVGAR